LAGIWDEVENSSRTQGLFLLPLDIKRKVKAQVTGPPGELRGERILNQNLRKLVQQLGEAIHESVSESEQIAGVVQDIRSQGFDVLLMLEATIGLNEVVEPSADAPLALESDGAGFTAQDVSFLRSLRIAIEGDEGPAGDDVEPASSDA
jgi:hypothetical protein